jgi:polar amino acid transport system substrate-binding protein
MKSIKKSGAVAVSIAVALLFAQSPAFAAVDSAAAGQLPAAIKKTKVINVGIDATYRPNEYKDANGKAIGWEVDMFNAISAKLGVKVNYVIGTFDSIIPAIKGGKYDVGLSSFTDTKEREAQVDFANYYSAGIQWASPTGKKVNPDAACGLIVAVQTGTTEVDDVKAKSADCTKAGKKAIKILPYDTQDQANAAVVLGRANALSADSPVTEDAVHQSKGKLQLAGAIYGTAPYGIAVAKGSTLAKAISLALTSMNKDGSYAAVLSKWGVSAGAVKTFGINGATA